jgi:SAM-dependent methyltransferase
VIPPPDEEEYEYEKENFEPESIVPDELTETDVNSDVSKKVRMQYEKLPYPFRDPEQDKKRLTMPMIDNLMVVNQLCFQGKKNFHDEFRMLVAGGGTGDASTYLAVQTAWLPNAKVVYIDLSTESMKIAKQRLRNQAVRLSQPRIERVVEFHHGSLLDVEKMGLGPFDYINCSGVLHHLKDPNEGLAALRSVLKDDGAMSIMVYGQVGRTTIYQIQELMRIVNRNIDDMDEKIKNTNLFLRYLPSSNLHRLGGRWGANESNPVEIYDLFLHSQDRAYTIGQLYDWVEGCGMSITAFSPGQHSFLSPELYPQTLSRKIRERIKGMSVREQRVFSELFYGHINKFEFHITPQSQSHLGIDWLDLDLIPCFSLLAKQQNMPARLAGSEESASLFHIPNHLDKLSMTIVTSPFAKSVYQRIDDIATVGEILQKMRSLYPQMSDEAIHRDILNNLKRLMQFDILHIRHKSCRCELLNRHHF